MVRRIAKSITVGSPALLVLLSSAGCLCPPCPTVSTQSAPVADDSKGAVSAPAAPGSRLIIWDGDGNGLEGGQSWADCDKKPDCKAKLEVMPGAGMNGTTGLVFHAEGPAWNGFGWNWFGWYPETAGTDIGPYENLTFWFRMEAKEPDDAPTLDAISISLGCSKGKKNSSNAELSKFAGNASDGKWHRVVIPLATLYQGKEGAEFDPASAWEFRLSTWSPAPRNFTIYLDEIAVEKP